MTSRNRPKHAVDGVATGAVSLARSVASGVTGIVSKPFEGARDGGFEGFFKGIGKGIVGVVAKPVVGVFDLASNVTEGIRNTTQVAEKELDRQRLPRFVGKDKVLRPYDARAALGWDWLQHLEDGKWAKEEYIGHLRKMFYSSCTYFFLNMINRAIR
jgi:vacuolar protein sorting-associated protein 13A/C